MTITLPFKTFINSTPTVGACLIVYKLQNASCHTRNLTLPPSLPPSISPCHTPNALCWKTLMLHTVGDVDDNTDYDDDDGGGGCATDDSVV